jgi:predicted membrane protein
MDIFQAIGFIGMIFIVWAYFLLQTGKYSIDSLYYQLLNLIGAILLIISLFVHFNLGSFLIEVFWIGITLYGMYKNWVTKKKKKEETKTE